MRTISLDSETTGGNIAHGDRAVDIGLVEMIDGRRTGRTWQSYLDPQGRKVHWGAQRVHGLSDDFLRGKPRFEDVADDMLIFIDGAPCVAHNARFDRDVIVGEFHTCGLPLPTLRFHDSITMARGVLKTGAMNLDAVVARLGIAAPPRKTHGALLDAEILAMVVETLEARQPGAMAAFLAGSSLDPVPRFLKPRMRDIWLPQAHAAAPDLTDLPAIGTDLNAGVADTIAAINALTGPMKPAQANGLRSGRDAWTDRDIALCAAVARTAHHRDVLQTLFDGLSLDNRKAGLRWICRGLKPDRFAAIVESYHQYRPDRWRDVLAAERRTAALAREIPDAEVEADSPQP